MLSSVQPLLMVLFRQRVIEPFAAWPHSAYAVGYLFLSCTRPPSPNQVQRVEPAFPFFVVTTMTPFAASVPYSVAADGPLTISMSSISSGLRPFSSDVLVPPTPTLIELELNRTPSTTQIGLLFSESEF